jgi:hypothetical protein
MFDGGEMEMSRKRPWWRYLRISVRGLRSYSGDRWMVRNVRVERNAAAAMKWLVDRLGDDFFGHFVPAYHSVEGFGRGARPDRASLPA